MSLFASSLVWVSTSHIWFPIYNCRDASISFKVYRRVKHCKIQVRIDREAWQTYWDHVSLCIYSWCHGQHLTFGFGSIIFEWMHRFHSMFTEGKSIVKYRSGLNLEIICKTLTELWPFLHLSFARQHFRFSEF